MLCKGVPVIFVKLLTYWYTHLLSAIMWNNALEKFKIVSRYQRIIYFKTLNDALIFWITTKLTLKTRR